MITSVILLILSLLAGVVAVCEKLVAPERWKRVLGWAALSVLLCSVGIQGYREYSTRKELESIDDFLSLEERRIDEASGAALLEDKIFIVDDEDRNVYEYQYEEGQDRATFREAYRIRSGEQMQSLIDSKTINKIDDLEAAATYNKKLYLVSSHSLNKKMNATMRVN